MYYNFVVYANYNLHALLQSNSDTNQFVMSWATCYRTD